MSLFDTIIRAVKPYDAETTADDKTLTVTNRQNGRQIQVFRETYKSQDGTDRFTEYIVEFSTQHRHFEDDEEEEIIDYILSIMRDEVLPIEFFCNGQRRFGGELDRKKNPCADPAKWLADVGCDAAQHAAFTYEINSWSGRFDTGKQNLTK